MIKHICPQCRVEFRADRYSRKYCSTACRGISQRCRTALQCLRCGTGFFARPSEQAKGNVAYCSRTCYETRPRPTLIDRFWPNVNRRGIDECWLWTGTPGAHGYGCIPLHAERTNMPAHRMAYMLAYGPIPKGRQINHTCDVRLCVNPRHLYAGSAAQNTRDMIERGRAAFRERHPMARLTAADVCVIRASEDSPHALAIRYGVTRNHIYRIRKGHRWA